MLTRRAALALFLTLCLLAGLVAAPSGPLLVCRMTGEPMPAIAANSPEASGSCCDVATTVGPDGSVRYALTNPGCCDLRPGIENAEPPAVTAPTAEMPVAALCFTCCVAPAPAVITLALPEKAPRSALPRAPPLPSASPRAPPFFS